VGDDPLDPGSKSVATMVGWICAFEFVRDGGVKDVFVCRLEGHVAEVIVGEVDDGVPVHGGDR